MEVDIERRVQIVLCSKLDNLLDVYREAEAADADADAEISLAIKLSFLFNQKYLDRPLYHHARRTRYARAQHHRTLSSGVICGPFVQQGWK